MARLADLTDDEWAALRAAHHAEAYPDGCRTEGHHCRECLERLGQVEHRVESRRVSKRYGSAREYRCTVPGCTADL